MFIRSRHTLGQPIPVLYFQGEGVDNLSHDICRASRDKESPARRPRRGVRKITHVFAVCFLLVGSLAQAQPVGLSLGGAFGRTLVHTVKLEGLAGEDAWVGQASLVLPQRQQGWEARLQFPMQFIHLEAGGFGKLDPLGRYAGLTHHVLFPLTAARRPEVPWSTARSFIGVGYGLSLASSPYRVDARNIALGSALNCLITFEGGYSLPVAQGRCVQFGLRLSHISNGALKLPNLGLNPGTAFLRYVVQAHRGQAVLPPAASTQEATTLPLARPRGHVWDIRAGLGVKQAVYIGGPRVYHYALTPTVLWRVSPGWRLGGGVEVSHAGQVAAFRQSQRVDGGRTRAANRLSTQAVVQGGLGHVVMHGEVGYYLIHPTARSQDRLYQRLGVQAHLYNVTTSRRGGPYVGVYLKSANLIADFVEFSVGYRR